MRVVFFLYSENLKVKKIINLARTSDEFFRINAILLAISFVKSNLKTSSCTLLSSDHSITHRIDAALILI